MLVQRIAARLARSKSSVSTGWTRLGTVATNHAVIRFGADDGHLDLRQVLIMALSVFSHPTDALTPASRMAFVLILIALSLRVFLEHFWHGQVLHETTPLGIAHAGIFFAEMFA